MVSPRDNVPITQGALTVASVADYNNVQHQEVMAEFLSSGAQPINVGVSSPLPVENTAETALLTAILIELRIANELWFSQVWPEVEELALLRAKYAALPVTM